MFAKLTSVLGGGTVLPFELGEPQTASWGHWSHFHGTLKTDGSPVSIFRIAAMNKEDPKLRAARNGVKRLRILRHPNILAFKDTVETEERGEVVIYLVTEAVTALPTTIRSLGLTGTQRDEYLSMGLYQVISALSFLNNDCKLIHGNVCAAAIVVTAGLDWRLHGFDLVTEHEIQQGYGVEIPLAAASWMVATQYKAGEVGKEDWQAVRDNPAWSVDTWGLGCLLHEVYSGSPLSGMEDLRSTDSIPQPVLPYYQKLLASAAPRRLNPHKLIESDVLKTKLGDTMNFLENLAIKDTMERDAFFKRLPSVLPSIPSPVAQKKLLPLLAAALEFGGAPPIALGTLLSIGESMSEGDRNKQVVPILTKLFGSNDRGIRRGLLENISSFGHGLPNNLVEEQIYPNVQTGFTDANPYLRELTLKSMVVLGPKLSQKTVNQSLLKHLAKLQVDEEPAIRANTTVLLGNLAPQLSDATCKKVLLNAFTRALKDPFPPARAAGLRAVLSTAKHHSPDDVAHRVVPMVGPLCVDPVQEVRSSALQCLHHFFKSLEDYSKELDKKLEMQAGAQSGASSASALSASSHGGGAATASGSLLTSFGWAVSSLVASSTSTQSHSGGNNNNSSNGVPLAGTTTMPSSSSSRMTPPKITAPAAALPQRTNQINNNNNNEGWDDADDFDALPSSTRSTNPTLNSGYGHGGSRNPTAKAEEENGWDNGKDGDDDDDDALEDMMDAIAAEKEARKRLSKVTLGGGGGVRPTTTTSRSTTSLSRSRPSAVTTQRAGGGMKLGVKKLAKDEAEEFADW